MLTDNMPDRPTVSTFNTDKSSHPGRQKKGRQFLNSGVRAEHSEQKS